MGEFQWARAGGHGVSVLDCVGEGRVLSKMGLMMQTDAERGMQTDAEGGMNDTCMSTIVHDIMI